MIAPIEGQEVRDVSRYALSLPAGLKQEAEAWARLQGVSLNQFILWAVAEKVGALGQGVDDPRFPSITYRRGAAGRPTPVLRGTAIRVQTIVTAAASEGSDAAHVAAEWQVPSAQVKEALAFYDSHRAEIEADLAQERALEAARAS